MLERRACAGAGSALQTRPYPHEFAVEDSQGRCLESGSQNKDFGWTRSARDFGGRVVSVSDGGRRLKRYAAICG